MSQKMFSGMVWPVTRRLIMHLHTVMGNVKCLEQQAFITAMQEMSDALECPRTTFSLGDPIQDNEFNITINGQANAFNITINGQAGSIRLTPYLSVVVRIQDPFFTDISNPSHYLLHELEVAFMPTHPIVAYGSMVVRGSENMGDVIYRMTLDVEEKRFRMWNSTPEFSSTVDISRVLSGEYRIQLPPYTLDDVIEGWAQLATFQKSLILE